MELQPIFLLGPLLLLHWGAPFQRAVRRDVELVACSWPAGGKRSLRHLLPVNPTWLPDPRLDRHRHLGHDCLLGIPRACKRCTHQPRGGRGLCDRFACPTRSGRPNLPAGNCGHDIRTAYVAVELERRAVTRPWRVDVRRNGATVGNGIGISTLGRHRSAVYCGLLVIDTALEPGSSIGDKGKFKATND